jgi:hypothetical protein
LVLHGKIRPVGRRGPVVAELAVESIGLAAFAGYRLAESIRFSPAVWQDSEAYMSVSLHPWFSSALWTGQRAPLVPALLKITGGYTNYSIAEAAFGAVAWGFLAWTASRLVDIRWRRALVFLLVLAFATAPVVASWDWSVLSESPSLSVLAILFACALWISRRFTWVRLAGLGVSALVYNGIRDSDIWDAAITGLILLAVVVVVTIRGAASEPAGPRQTMKDNFQRAKPTAAVGVVLIAVAVVTGAGADVSHRNILNIEEAFYIRIFPFPDRVAWFSAHGMPQGSDVDTLAKDTGATDQAVPVEPPLNEREWRALRAWFEHDALTTYAFFLISHPVYVLEAPFQSPPLTYNNASGQLQSYEPPGRSISVMETLFAPNKFVVISWAVLGILVAFVRGTWRRPELRLLMALILLGLMSMLLAWHGEGQEVTRHMVEGDIQARLGVLLLLVLSLLASSPKSVEVHEEAGHTEELVEMHAGT